MPELPEVETIRLGLQKYLVGHTIKAVDVKVPKLFEGSTEQIIGAKVKDIRRKGKGLIIDLSNGNSLAIHIKLTGQLIYRSAKTKNIEVSKSKVGTLPNPFTHVIFKLKSQNAKGKNKSKNSKVGNEDSDAVLYYNDQRRFGWIKVVKTSEVDNIPFFKTLGPEPPVASSFAGASKDKKAMEGQGLLVLTLDKFINILSGKNTAIKPLIMDQTKIGGIGNIYANDALNLAKIDPRRAAKTLSKEEIKVLYEAVLEVMKKSFKYGGASELNFVNALGQEGKYQRHSLVYGKKGKPCPNCKGIIKKIYLGGRGTFFCENCQE